MRSRAPLALTLLSLAATLCGCAPVRHQAELRGAGAAAVRERLDPARLEGAFATLLPLVLARGVSGHEGAVREVISEQLQSIDPSFAPVTDEAGNLILSVGRGERTLLFIAHMDEIGLEVTAIRPDGLLESARRGGLLDHLFQETAIELVTARGVLPGIALPAAAAPDGASHGAAPASAPAPAPAAGPGGAPGAAAAAPSPPSPPPPILLDVGARSAAEAVTLGVALGDAATVPKELRRLGAHRAAGRSNDDRVGCAALLMALQQLHPDLERLDRRVVFVWSTREEVGLEGADHAARTLRPVPETVFAVDTFVTSDNPREDSRYAFAPLGAGPVLRALDNTSVTPDAVLDRVRAIAARQPAPIPLQTGTMGGGNDGSRFVPEGSIDCPLAWPQRASHSRVETLDLRDLSRLADLVAGVAREY